MKKLQCPDPAGVVAATGNGESTDWITQATLLERIPISRRTAFKWRKQGILPAVQIDDKIIFHWPTVCEALLRRQRVVSK